MIPIIGFVCWNRMGMNIQNLKLLLNTNEDFELYIVDNNSKDDTFSFLKTLKDPRIKEIKKFKKNYGLVYALNYIISKRKKDQPFINIDADVSILNDGWIKNCENVISNFPEIGILGNVRPTYFNERSVEYTELIRGGVRFWKTSSIIGCCMYFPSNTLDILGYFNEEICLPDIEIHGRIEKSGKIVGYCPDNKISYQPVTCSNCKHDNLCKKPNTINHIPSCLINYNLQYKHMDIYNRNIHLMNSYLRQIDRANLYRPSIHDLDSIIKYKYDINMAKTNFRLFSKDD